MSAVPIGTLAGGGQLRLDVPRLVDTRLLVQANSGGGKSWVLRRLLEQTHGRVQHLVVDPEGEFASLRERFDYVLAAKTGGDTVVDPRSARLLAERLLGSVMPASRLPRATRQARSYAADSIRAVVEAIER